MDTIKRSTVTYLITPEGKTIMAEQQRKVIGLKGYGGIIESNEEPHTSAVREIWEESGGEKKRRLNPNEEGGILVNSSDLIPVALIDFYNGTEKEIPFGSPSFRMLCYVCYLFKGKAISTHEMHNPDEYPLENLPYEKMIIGDNLFLGNILTSDISNKDRKCYKGFIRRTSDWKEIIEHEILPCKKEDLVL